MNILKSIAGKNGWLTLVFTSIFLFSFGMILHNAFADTVVQQISIPYCSCGIGYGPFGIGVNQNTNTAYLDVSGGFGGKGGAVYVINDMTDSITGTITTNGGPGGVAVNPNTNKIYVADEGLYSTRPKFYLENSVFAINGSANNIMSGITVGYGPYGIGVNPNTNTIYVANSGSNSISVINGTTDTVTSTISVGSNPISIATNPNTNMIYVANSGSNTVSIIDGSTNGIVGTMSGFNGPGGIGINPNTNKIYVVNSNNGTLSVIDGSTNGITSSIFVGNGASEVRVNPLSNKIYVDVDGSYGSGGTVSVIDGSNNIFMQAIQVPTGPHGIDINPTMNKIYVSSYDYGTVSVIDGSSSSISSEPTAPSAPQNLTATLVLGPDNYNYLTWSSPSTNGGSQITNYKIYRSTVSGAETLLAISSNGLSYYDYHPAYGQTYYYKVSAVTSFGESPLSNEFSIRGPTSPQPPTGLMVSASSASQINLIWTAPSDSGTSPITAYKIERSSDSGSTWSTIQSNTASTSTTYSDTGLAHSTTYTYRVSAINQVGTGQPSVTASATTFNVVPSPPIGLTAATQLLKINLSWNAPSDNGGTQITGYMVERSTDNGNTWSTIVSNTGSTGTTYSDKNVLPLTTYTYRVSAINNMGTGSPSNTASASIASAPTLP